MTAGSMTSRPDVKSHINEDGGRPCLRRSRDVNKYGGRPKYAREWRINLALISDM